MGDLGDRGEDITNRLKRQGSFDEIDAQNMLAEIDAGCEFMGKILEEDKARQQELLKKRLEARRRKRAKLQQDLKVVEEQLDAKEADVAAKEEEATERHNNEYLEKCKEAEQDCASKEQALDQALKEQKQDRLASYEDKLRDAKHSTDFAKELDEYQNAQAKIDKELEKQRAKEQAELQRLLKNRRNKAKSEKALKLQAELK